MKDILEFQGEHRWLSNFWPAKVEIYGMVYPTVENAYQAAKTYGKSKGSFRDVPFLTCTPGQAKRLAREMSIRSDWDEVKVDVMRNLIRQKFAPKTELAAKLLETGDCQIVEGNRWGDTFWGVCNGVGRNMLGGIIMEIREDLRRGELT